MRSNGPALPPRFWRDLGWLIRTEAAYQVQLAFTTAEDDPPPPGPRVPRAWMYGGFSRMGRDRFTRRYMLQRRTRFYADVAQYFKRGGVLEVA